MSYLDSTLDFSWLTVALALLFCVIIFVSTRWTQVPPGPWGLPYLGYYPFLRKDYHVQLRDMTKKYGDVFCLKCTGQVYVYLGSIRAIKEAHVTKSDYFTQRTGNFSVIADILQGGLFTMNGQEWKELRKFFVQSFREFRLSENIQESLMDYLKKTANEIRETNGENFDALTFFIDICTKMIYSVLLSGYKVDDDDVRTFNEAYSVVLEHVIGTNSFLTGPLLKLKMHTSPEFRRYRRSKLLGYSIFAKIIEGHEKSFDKNNIRNMVDSYINTRKQLEEKRDPKSELYTDKALQGSIIQFIGDGGSFVGFIISLILQKLCDHPDMQKEIQHEIDDVVGRSRFPSIDDKSRMPYTNAVIQEFFRITDTVSIISSLECTKETTIEGCRVPKGAITLMGIWAASQDPSVYEQPEKFDPTRFLPSEEQKPKSIIPPFFGLGKRSCIGEPLVLMETFLVVSTVLQSFDLHPANKSGIPESSAKKKETQELKVVFRATPRKS